MRHEYKIQIKALEIFERKKIEHEKCFFGWAKQYNHILLASIWSATKQINREYRLRTGIWLLLWNSRDVCVRKNITWIFTCVCV